MTTEGAANSTFSVLESGNYYFTFNESTLRYSIKRDVDCTFRVIEQESNVQPQIKIVRTGEKSFMIENINNADIIVYHSLGSKIYAKKNISSHQSLELKNLSAGVYILKIKEKNTDSTIKIILK